MNDIQNVEPRVDAAQPDEGATVGCDNEADSAAREAEQRVWMWGNEVPNRVREALEECCTVELPDDALGDVIGLEGAKTVLMEAFVLPKRFPQVFAGRSRKPIDALMFYGPPGTGKRMLSRAAASECDSFLVHLSFPALLSNTTPSPALLFKTLFSLARTNAPTIISLPDLDAAPTHEPSAWRHAKTELLLYLDTLDSAAHGVRVLATTQAPWAIDGPLIKRFNRRVYTPPPPSAARAALLRACLSDVAHAVDAGGFATLTRESARLGAAQIRAACAAAKAALLARGVHAEHVVWEGGLFLPCGPSHPRAQHVGPGGVPAGRLALPVLQIVDVRGALGEGKAPRSLLERYEAFTRERGVHGGEGGEA